MPEENNLVAMTIEVVASYVAHNNIRPEDVPDFIAKTQAAIAGIAKEPETPAEETPAAQSEFTPAIFVRKSLASPDHILSMIDGKPYKSLKRHLSSHGLTPAECRVAVSLLELESIGQVAASLARSEETIRSQVKAIFTKTGTHSQAQLVKLLYALSQS